MSAHERVEKCRELGEADREHLGFNMLNGYEIEPPEYFGEEVSSRP